MKWKCAVLLVLFFGSLVCADLPKNDVAVDSRMIIPRKNELYNHTFGTAGAPAWSFYSDSNTGIYRGGSDELGISTGGNTRLWIDNTGNVGIGGTPAAASSAGNLSLFNGTVPTGSETDGIVLYAEDVAASSELKVRDEAGNITTLSPHHTINDKPLSEDMAWSFYSERHGKYVHVDMLKVIRLVEKLAEQDLVTIGEV